MIAALILGWAVLYADRTALYPLLSVIADTLGITSTQAGAITSAYFLFYVLLQIPSGLAADRWGAKRVLMSMFALSGLGILGFGLFGTSFSLLVFFSALHGLGAGAYYPCCFGTMLSTVPAEKRGISSGLIGMGMALGILGGMAVSGPLYQFFGNYRTPFLLLAVPTALMLPLFKKYLPDVKNESSPSLAVYKSCSGTGTSGRSTSPPSHRCTVSGRRPPGARPFSRRNGASLSTSRDSTPASSP